MVHKPKHKVHSFRGLLGDGGQDEINLERSNLNLAYRIVKFAIIQTTPGAALMEGIMKVYRESQTTIDGVIDFTNTDLLAAGFQADYNTTASTINQVIIFDNVLFSRNIYVTFKDVSTGESCNYYLELEEVPVGPATLMQLKLGVARKLNLSESPPDA